MDTAQLLKLFERQALRTPRLFENPGLRGTDREVLVPVFKKTKQGKTPLKTLNEWLAADTYIQNPTVMNQHAALVEDLRMVMDIRRIIKGLDSVIDPSKDKQTLAAYKMLSNRAGYGLEFIIAFPQPHPYPDPHDTVRYHTAEVVVTRGVSITLADMTIWFEPVANADPKRYDIGLKSADLERAVSDYSRQALRQTCCDLVATFFDCEIFQHAALADHIAIASGNRGHGNGGDGIYCPPNEDGIIRFQQELMNHYELYRTFFHA